MINKHTFSGLFLIVILSASIAAFVSTFSVQSQNCSVETLDTLMVVERATVPLCKTISAATTDSEVTTLKSYCTRTRPEVNRKIPVERTNRISRGTIPAEAAPDSVTTLINLAESYYQQKYYFKSLDLFKKARTIKNTVIDRTELVKVCINGEAKCLKELRLKGIVPQ